MWECNIQNFFLVVSFSNTDKSVGTDFPRPSDYPPPTVLKSYEKTKFS